MLKAEKGNSMALRLLGRVMITVPHIANAVSAIREPKPHAARMRNLSVLAADKLNVPAIAKVSQFSESQVNNLVKLHASTTIAAAALTMVRPRPRVAAAVLALTSAPLVISYFPRSKKSVERDLASQVPVAANDSKAFLNALALTGGALAIAADTGGKPSLKWKIDNALAKRQANREAKKD